GEANIIVATGASQFEMLSELIKEEIDWTKVTGFHLDEYVGMELTHPASFRKYLKERFVDKTAMKEFFYVNADVENPDNECARLGNLINDNPIDVAFIGIGENGHLAFNDPPANFETEVPYIVVTLDDACRKQQLGEGWFPTFDDVPKQAISMSINQILKSTTIICSVPDERKAVAVKGSVEEPISPMIPGTVMQKHAATWLFLDTGSASLLKTK
ncbi:MAG: glucosamine-6-phosphate deaminase, partial [Draconibacterium sp.]|nr:glucosamine-6-phosphate deaminase [Draconibacterium sp.]